MGHVDKIERLFPDEILLAAIGYNTIAEKGSSTTAWGSARLGVALVLDNSGSMAPTADDRAQKRGTQPLNSIAKCRQHGDVYVSIISITTVVKVGSSNSGATERKLARSINAA